MRRVNPKVYTKTYYLTDCAGNEEFKISYGKQLDIVSRELIKRFEVNPDMDVLDIGCGRGEMVFYCASKGAKSIGIDYADASTELANFARTKYSKKIQNKTKFIKMDAKKLSFPASSFDLIIMSGVVEHLYPKELDAVFNQIKRVLKPNGKLVISTAPNKIFNNIAYKFYCYPLSSLITFFWNKLTNSKYPNIPRPQNIRTESHLIMHINEPTFLTLRNLYKKFNFKGNLSSSNITVVKPVLSLKDSLFNFFVFLHPFSKHFPLSIVFGSDFISVLTNVK